MPFEKDDRVKASQRLIDLVRGMGLRTARDKALVAGAKATVVDTSEFDAGELELIYVKWDHEDEATTCHPVNITMVKPAVPPRGPTAWERIMEDE